MWPRRHALTLRVTYRGGAESWWLIESRGSSGVFPGHLGLEDVMTTVLNESDYGADHQDEADANRARKKRGLRPLD